MVSKYHILCGRSGILPKPNLHSDLSHLQNASKTYYITYTGYGKILYALLMRWWYLTVQSQLFERYSQCVMLHRTSLNSALTQYAKSAHCRRVRVTNPKPLHALNQALKRSEVTSVYRTGSWMSAIPNVLGINRPKSHESNHSDTKKTDIMLLKGYAKHTYICWVEN